MTGYRPLVSIVTPSYQQGRFLHENLASVRNQGYPNIEQIVRDGGSMDETVKLLRTSGKGVRWTSEPDQGQTDAINRALAESRGKIIGWVNSDDFLYPDAVERAVDAILETGADAVYGRCLLVDQDGGKIGFYRTEPFSYRRLLSHNIIAQPGLFFRRSLYERFGPLDETLHFAMDYEYWLRCSREARFHYIPELVAAYRIHTQAKTTTDARAHAAETNRLRRRYNRGLVPAWRLESMNLRTYVGGVAKSTPVGMGLIRALKWQRERN
jgi:glycosyltransferase involved in cell wall biosynthesis